MTAAADRTSPNSLSRYSSIRALLRASWVYFTQCLQAALVYRSSLAIFVITESLAYAGFIAFWYKAATNNPSQSAYTPMALVLYFGLASFQHGIQHHASSRDIGSDIRLGKLSYSIIRPFPFLLQAVLRSVAFTLTYITLLSPLLIAALVFVPGLFDVFKSGLLVSPWWHYPAAIVLGLTASWLARILVGLLAFDMAQIWGPDTFFIALYYAASGVVFPIDLLPTTFLRIAQWTPMYYMIGFPVLTVMGRVQPANFAGELIRGSIVLTITAIVILWMWRRGIKRFEAIGI